MLSRWKKEYREGRLLAGARAPANNRKSKLERRAQKAERELRRLQGKLADQSKLHSLERQLRVLEIENDLLKKAIRFNLERRKRSSRSSSAITASTR